MKKTIWQPVLFGMIFGALAGITTMAGLIFVLPGPQTENAIGLYNIFFLLATALGGPLAGVISSSMMLIITFSYGPIELREILNTPSIFWSNLLVMAALLVLVGLAYRWIHARIKMPKRILAWAGIVTLFYLLLSPINISIQFILEDTALNIPSAILSAYQSFIPQALFDIFFTSLVFIALPVRFVRPVWYESE